MTSCPHCGVRLVGEDAARLWTVNQQIAALQAEAGQLLASMRESSPDPGAAPDPAVRRVSGSMTAGVPAMPAPNSATPAGARAAATGRGLSGQGILLALGGLLLLAGAGAFVVVVWLLVGVYGQALLMAGATIASVVVARILGKRGLSAGAEAFAVVACGLLVLDLWGAHHLDFAGLGAVAPGWYGAVAALFGAACAVLADRITRPRRFGYAPFAALLASLAPWSAVAALDFRLAPLVATIAGAFLFDLVVLGVAIRAERPGWRRAPAVIAAGTVAVIGLAGFVCTDIGLGFDTRRSTSDHVEAALLALLVPLLVLAAFALRLPERLDVAAALRLPALWVIGSSVAVAGGMVVFDAPIGVLIAVAVLLAALVIAGAVWSVHATVRVLAGVAAVAQALLAFWVAIDHEGLWQASSAPTHAIPALLWAVAAVVRTITDREVVWLVVAEVAVALTVARGCADVSSRVGVVVTAGMLVSNGVIAGVAAREPRKDVARTGISFAAGTEVVAVLAVAAWAVAALGLAVAVGEASWTAVVFWIIGAVCVAHASVPHRFAFAYLGALSIAVGIWVLLGSHDVGTVEAYSLPLAAMLGVVGWLQARRRRGLPTVLTAGPALAVALAPSLIAAVTTGSAVRVAVITLVGVVVLLVGLLRRWLAPVVAGIAVLVFIALTQGGPLLAYVPSWLILTVCGALLLGIGVRWEATVTAGRRAGVWFGSLA